MYVPLGTGYFDFNKNDSEPHPSARGDNNTGVKIQRVDFLNIVSLLFQEKKGNVPFRRVKSEEVLVDRRLADNSFEAKVSIKKSLFP